MKLYMKSLMLLLFLGTVASCNDSFLDQTQTSDLNRETVFADSTYTANFLTGIYTDIGFDINYNRWTYLLANGGGLQSACDEAEFYPSSTIWTNMMFATGTVNPVTVSDDAKAVADMYLEAKKAMIVFNQNLITTEAASLLADIALVSGHIGTPRDGILQVKAKNNSQGLVDLGITAGAEELEGVKALVVFGEEADIDTDALEFLAVSDTHMTALAAKADVVIPGTGFASTDGTYTNTERRLQLVQAAIEEDVELANWEIAAEIAHVFEVDYEWENTEDISVAMNDEVPAYKYAVVDEVLGGVLKPADDARLAVIGDAKFADPIKCTDSLMNVIVERLPKPANPTA